MIYIHAKESRNLHTSLIKEERAKYIHYKVMLRRLIIRVIKYTNICLD
jgi:hypothetical protein